MSKFHFSPGLLVNFFRMFIISVVNKVNVGMFWYVSPYEFISVIYTSFLPRRVCVRNVSRDLSRLDGTNLRLLLQLPSPRAGRGEGGGRPTRLQAARCPSKAEGKKSLIFYPVPSITMTDIVEKVMDTTAISVKKCATKCTFITITVIIHKMSNHLHSYKIIIYNSLAELKKSVL